MNRKLLAVALFLLLISALFLSLSMPVKATGENWLSDWVYRKSHIINNATGAGTKYQVRIYVWNSTGTDSGNNVSLGSNVLSNNFGDIRFTDDDGSTLLDYWMESVNSTTATFWVEVADSLESSAQTIYIYYGKVSTTTTSNGDNTFLFFDDFSGASLNITHKWYKYGDGTATVSNGILTIASDSDSDTGIYMNTTSYSGYTYKRIRSLVNIQSASGKNSFWGFCAYNSGNDIGGIFAIGTAKYLLTRKAGAQTLKASNFNVNNFYKQEILWKLNQMNFYDDGIGELSNSPVTTNIPIVNCGAWYTAGSGTSTTQADWVFISNYVSPEPTHGAWGSEEANITYYVNFSNVSSNSTMLGTSAMMTAYWDSNDTLNSYLFEWNFSGSWVSDSPVSFTNSTPPQWSNITKSLGTNVAMWAYAISWRINVTTTNSKTNSTENQNFILTAIVVNYYVPSTGTLKINSTATSNSTVKYPHDTSLIAESLPSTGYSFYNFTENSVYYNSNPSTITFPVTNFMANYASNFTMILGTGGGLNRIGPASLAEIAIISLICIPAALIILLMVLRRRK